MKILLCFVLLFWCVASVTGQEKVIDKSEFDAVVAEGNNHYLRWKDEKYRMTVLTSSKVIGRPQTDSSSKMIIEFASPEEKRTVRTSTFGGKPNPIHESILIGKWMYTLVGPDSWTRKEYEPSRAPADAPESPFQTLGTAADYRYLGREQLGGKTANVYRKTERQTKVNQKNGENTESDAKSTYWFGEDGALLKNEYRSESRSASLTIHTLVVLEWAIDPSIVITEPTVTPLKPELSGDSPAKRTITCEP
jgi:hypothetical protein